MNGQHPKGIVNGARNFTAYTYKGVRYPDEVDGYCHELHLLVYLANEYLLKQAGKSKYRQAKEWRAFGVKTGNGTVGRLGSGYYNSIQTAVLGIICWYWRLPMSELLEIGIAEKKRLAAPCL